VLCQQLRHPEIGASVSRARLEGCDPTLIWAPPAELGLDLWLRDRISLCASSALYRALRPARPNRSAAAPTGSRQVKDCPAHVPEDGGGNRFSSISSIRSLA
jgi:hypothetical protein